MIPIIVHCMLYAHVYFSIATLLVLLCDLGEFPHYSSEAYIIKRVMRLILNIIFGGVVIVLAY